MNNSILIPLIKRLSARELTKFKEYLASPIYNKREKIRTFYHQISLCAPNYKPAKLNKRRIFDKIFAGDDYDELKINNLASDLLSLLYDFLAYWQYQKNKALQKQLLVKELLQRDIHDHIDRNARNYYKTQANSSIRNFEYFHSEYEMHDKMDQYALAKGIRAYDPHLQQKSDALDLYYIGNKLRIAVDMTSRNFVSNAGYICHQLPDILKAFEENSLKIKTHPALSIYYKTLQMLEASHHEDKDNESEFHFKELKKQLSENLNLFPVEELRVLYLYLQNYCIYKINSGQSTYYQEILDLYKFLLEKKIIFKNGYLPQSAYKNIVTVGIRLKDFDWTEKMIYQHQENLLPKERENVVAYNLAAVYYAKKDYKNALQQLHNVEFTDNSFHLGAKIIQLKSYYETDEYEAFIALIEAFRKYVRRNKDLAKYRKEANLNFLKMASQIFSLQNKRSIYKPEIYTKKRETIKQNLQSLSVVANKEWLLEIFGRL